MAIDPTQQTRDLLKAGIKAALPSSSPIMQSGRLAVNPLDAAIAENKRNAANLPLPTEEENLVMARTAPTPEELATNVVDPNIPITPPSQEISTQTAAPVIAPAQGVETGPIQPTMQPQVSSADAGFDAIAKQQDAFQKSLEDDFKRREEFAKKKYSEVETELAKINANPVQIDNRSLWAKSSTGQKILLSVGALLSSMSPNSAKAFQENIQNTIDTDLKLQMDQLNQQRADKKSLLGQLQQITGDSDSAAAAYKSQVYGLLANKLQLTAQKAQSKIQREQALMNYNLASEQRDIEKAKLLQTLQQKQDEGSIPGFQGQVKDQVAARDFRAKIAEKPAVIGEIDNLLNINKQFLGGALSPSASASAKQSQNLLIGKLREAIVGPGTLSETDRDLLEKAIANPTDFFTLGSSNKIKLEKLKKSYENALSSHAAALGLKQVGKPTSFQGQ
jgi:hypothetical protein